MARVEALIAQSLGNLSQQVLEIQSGIETYIDSRLGKPAQEQGATAQQHPAQNTVPTPTPPGVNVAQSTPDTSTTQAEAIAKTDTELHLYPPGLSGGISQNELCRRFRITPNNVSANAKRARKTTEQYLMEKTGWIRKNGRWFPY